MTTTDLTACGAELREFALVHCALRSGSRLLAEAVASIAAGEPCSQQRHEAIVAFTRHVLREISEHQRKEDDILWPVVAAAVPAGLDLAALCDVHGVLDGVLTRTRGALKLFAASGSAGAPALAAALAELADELAAHITAKETALFPVIAEYVPSRELARCTARFARRNPRAHRIFVRCWLDSVAGGPVRIGRRRRQARWLRRRDLVANG